MNIYGKLIDILIGICIMLLFPVLYYQKKSELLIYEAVQQRMEKLVSQTATTGRLTKEGWEQFQTEISKFDEIISMEFYYTENRYEPVYQVNDTAYFTDEIIEYTYEIDDYEIRQILNDRGRFVMQPDGYFRVTVTFADHQNKLYYGGRIRANISFVDTFFNHNNNLYYNSGYCI